MTVVSNKQTEYSTATYEESTNSLGLHTVKNLTGAEPLSPVVNAAIESSSEGSSPRSSLSRPSSLSSLSSQSSTSRPETPPPVYAPGVFTISPSPSSHNYKIINSVMTLRDATFGDISETTTRDRATKQMARDFAGERHIVINGQPFFPTLQRLEGTNEADWEEQKALTTEVQAELVFEHLKQTIKSNCKTSSEPELDLITSKTLLAATQVGPHSTALQSFQFVKSKIPEVHFISNISNHSTANITIGKDQLLVTENQKLRANDENGNAVRILDLEHTCEIITDTVSMRGKVHKVDQGSKSPKINFASLAAAFNRFTG